MASKHLDSECRACRGVWPGRCAAHAHGGWRGLPWLVLGSVWAGGLHTPESWATGLVWLEVQGQARGSSGRAADTPFESLVSMAQGATAQPLSPALGHELLDPLPTLSPKASPGQPQQGGAACMCKQFC
jgi:hypothetical protein